MKSPYFEIGKLYTLDSHDYPHGLRLTPIGSQLHNHIPNNTPMMLIKCDNPIEAVFLIEDKLYQIYLDYVDVKKYEL
jgi:hypothetical protein